METSAGRVSEIERVSRDIDSALSTIAEAAERTRVAAVGVTSAAEANAYAVTSAATNLVAVAKTAEGHAAAAEQVNASTQEQSAACEQMTSASNVLLGEHAAEGVGWRIAGRATSDRSRCGYGEIMTRS